VGGNAKSAARHSLPPALRGDATVTDGDGVKVRVRAPSLLPGMPSVPVTASSGLGTGDVGQG
jgi:hypothetical protein